MTTQQPEALRLADALPYGYELAREELRRLHARVQELESERTAHMIQNDRMAERIADLEASEQLHLQELRSYRITVENREARIVELEAQLAAAQQGVLPNDKGLRDKVARALGCGTGTNYAWSYLLKQIECLVECEEELIALKESTRSHTQGLEQSVQKVVQDWQRQKNLFPQLHKDGWMDLALSELAAQAKQGGA